MGERIRYEHVFKVGPGQALINGEYHTFDTFTAVIYSLTYEREYDAEHSFYVYRYIHNGNLKFCAIPLIDLSEQEKKDLLYLANIDSNDRAQEQEGDLEEKVFYLQRKAA